MLTYQTSGIESIEIIKPLLAKLSEYHKITSNYFSKDFEIDNYYDRKRTISRKQHVQVTIAYDANEPIGYLVASVHKGEGMIESLYVDTAYRGNAIGDTMMTTALEWIKTYGPADIKVSVAFGNQVLSFYEKYGFYPRSIILKNLSEQVV